MKPSTARELRSTPDARRRDRVRTWAGLVFAVLIGAGDWYHDGFDGSIVFMVLLAICWVLTEYQREAEAQR